MKGDLYNERWILFFFLKYPYNLKNEDFSPTLELHDFIDLNLQ